jgi:hypothetical protein
MLITEVYKIPVLVSLGVIAAVLAVTIGASLWVSRREAEAEAEREPTSEN